MASTHKQVNGNATTNGNSGKRKKTRSSKVSYLSKWLDRSIHHVPESAPSMDTYDSIPNSNWQMSSQFAPGFDPCRFIYGCSEPMSLPTLPTYYNPPLMGPFYGPEYRYMQNKNEQVQRPRERRRNEHNTEEVNNTSITNGSLSKNYLQMKNVTDSQDYASLPPIVTSVGDTTSNSDRYTNEKEDGSNNRRYSDPCVQGLPDVALPAKGEVESSSEDSSIASGSQVGGRLLSCLLDQITTLKMANERLNKELQETKAELNCVRQQNTIWQKSSNSSLGGTPNHSPLNNNGLGAYSPGILTDIVREIRDAARQREEALYSRVRAMVHERTDINGLTTPDTKLSDRSLEEIKSSLRASEADKRRMLERINKLEDELRQLRVAGGLETNDNASTNGTIDETEAERLRLRKEVADLRKGKQTAEDHAHKLERLVTQLRSKFNGMQLNPNGPESLTSEPEHETARVRRTSSSNNSTVVFGPVTEL